MTTRWGISVPMRDAICRLPPWMKRSGDPWTFGKRNANTSTSMIGGRKCVIRHAARSEQTRAAQLLVMGPWPHNVNGSTQLGDVDFGPDSVVNLQEMQLQLFNRWLKDEQNGLDGKSNSEADRVS